MGNHHNKTFTYGTTATRRVKGGYLEPEDVAPSLAFKPKNEEGATAKVLGRAVTGREDNDEITRKI